MRRPTITEILIVIAWIVFLIAVINVMGNEA